MYIWRHCSVDGIFVDTALNTAKTLNVNVVKQEQEEAKTSASSTATELEADALGLDRSGNMSSRFSWYSVSIS